MMCSPFIQRAATCLLAIVCGLSMITSPWSARAADDDQWVVYEGTEGVGAGKHIVFVSGDEEYRSEEALPMLARIMAFHYGFKCTVLFSIDPENGYIDPNNQNNIPGLEALDDADLMVMSLRFRNLPDEQMKHIVDFFLAGKPIIGLRTSTHAFNIGNRDSKYVHWTFNSRDWQGGFGQQVLGDTWISHHGHHKVESTRGVIDPANAEHPVLTGVTDVWGPTDVYGIVHLPEDATVLLHGQVLQGMKPDDAAVEGPKNDPMMPLAWVRTHHQESGTTNRVFCTTMGASTDLECEDLRRLVVNASFWCLGMESDIPEQADVSIIGDYNPTMYGFTSGDHWKELNLRPSDFRWPR